MGELVWGMQTLASEDAISIGKVSPGTPQEALKEVLMSSLVCLGTRRRTERELCESRSEVVAANKRPGR